MAAFWVEVPCDLLEFYQHFRVLTASIFRAMNDNTLRLEAARTSEMLVNFCQTTQHYNQEDSHLHTHHRENLKSYYLRNLLM
jgi:hypothetical protein